MSSKEPLSVQPPKGTRDFYPEEMRLQRHIFDAWEKACRRFGFEEYEGPTFESLDLYTGKSGDEIVTQLYNFTDKGGRDLALRPELTPTLARMVNQKGPSLKLPLKWFSIPRLFRYEKAQKGRLREFYQLNLDIVGCDSVRAEADLLSCIVEMLKSLGLTARDFSLRLSSRRLLSDYLDRLGLPEENKAPVYAALDKKAKLPPEEFRRLLLAAGLDEERIGKVEAFFSASDLSSLSRFFPEGGAASRGLAELRELFDWMSFLGYGDYCELDLSVVRGLAYYTGIVFEVYDRGRTLRAVAGGGRYDNLLEKLGGRPLSGVGFGMGDVVLLELLRERGLLPARREGKDALDYFLVFFEKPVTEKAGTEIEKAGTENAGSDPGAAPDAAREVFRLAGRLREKGLSAAYALNGGKLKKQLAQADEAGARKVLFFGSDKAPPGQFEVKDLRTGEQSLLSFEAL